MTAAAKRYKMSLKNEEQLEKKPVVQQQVGPRMQSASAPQTAKTEEWSTVVKRGKKKKEESVQETTKNTSDYELFPEDWSQPLMQTLKLATPGVILAGQQDGAQRMARMLKGTKHPVAIISIEPLPHSVQSEHIVFRAQQVVQRGQQQVRHEKILQGYLANFGPQMVRPLLKVATVSCPQKQLASTSVILLSSRRSVVTAETWQQIRKYSTLRDVKAGLQSVPGAPQRIVDLFNLQCTNDEFAVRVRVMKDDMSAWLCLEAPFAVHPIGDTSEFRILWDPTVKTLAEARSRYSPVSGYQGLALTSKGLGARFTSTTIASARKGAGMAAGELYQISGLPCTMLESEIVSVLQQAGWQADLLSHSRRVRSGMTMYKARSERAPPQKAIRLHLGAEIITLQITEIPRPERVQKQSTHAAPSTWAQVAKQALGKADQRHAGATKFPNPTAQRTSVHTRGDVTPEADEFQEEDDDMSDAPQLNIEEIWEQEQEYVDAMPLSELPDYEPPIMQPTIPAKKRKTGGSNARPFMSRTTTVGKARVQRVESDLQEVKASLAMVMQHLQAQLPRQVEQVRVHRVSIPYSDTLMPTLQTAAVPGDGGCLWHSLQAHVQGFQPNEKIAAEAGHALKASLLQLYNQNATQCAGILGVAPERLPSILNEWRPDEAWADGRALALASAHYRVNIAVWNKTDSCVDIVTPMPDALSAGQWWHLEYGSDHYVPGINVEPARLANALQHASFLPWYPTQHGRGGATADWRESRANGGTPTSFAPDRPMPITCLDWNLGGWRQHAPQVLEKASEAPCVMFLQETHLTRDGQRSAQKTLNAMDYEGNWGAAAEWKRTSKGFLRTDWGACPGVAILTHTSLQASPCHPKTPQGKRWWQCGRMVMSRVVMTALPVLLMCLYTPAGKEREIERNEMLTDLCVELQAQDTHRYMIAGDFNCDPTSNPLTGFVVQAGAGIPRWVSPEYEEVHHTYESGISKSRLDSFLIGPDLETSPCQVVYPITGSPHAMLTCQTQLDTPEMFPRVLKQVKVTMRQGSEHDRPTFEWAPCHAMIHALIQKVREIAPERRDIQWQIQEGVDAAWECFHQCFREHVSHRAEIRDTSGHSVPARRLGQSLIGTCNSRAKRKQQTPMSHDERMCLCIARNANRLVDLMQGTNTARVQMRILREGPQLSMALGITMRQLQDDIDCPEVAHPRWKKRWGKMQKNLQTKLTRKWRTTLLQDGRPTPRLFSWLKGAAPLPGMSIIGPDGHTAGPRDTFSQFRKYWQKIMQPPHDSDQHLLRHHQQCPDMADFALRPQHV